MRFLCHDPFSEVSRVIDIARRLDLPLSRLTYVRLDDGSYRLSVGLLDDTCPRAAVFAARLTQLADLIPEECDA